MTCHACDREAIVRYRVVPYSQTMTLWDSTPRDILACKSHLSAAQATGIVLSSTPLSDAVVTRVVQ